MSTDIRRKGASCQAFIFVLRINLFAAIFGSRMRVSTIPRSSLYLATVDLLHNRPITLTLQMISDATTIPKGWLLSLSRNPDMIPTIDRVEHLYNYLMAEQAKRP